MTKRLGTPSRTIMAKAGPATTVALSAGIQTTITVETLTVTNITEQMRQRITELEGLRPCPFCGGEAEIINIDEGENAGGSCVCCKRCMASGNIEFDRKENFVSNWNRRATSLLSAVPPASEPDADVVERVARAMFVSDPPAGMIGPDWDTGATLGKGNATRHKFHALARAALSAMRPSVDAEKIAGIRARHESVADMADDEWDNRIYTIADDAFSDRAFLLSVIEGVNHDD
ncbi:Lar family restriction alleviation protein [Hyphomonas sp. CY54-11-8]|uniref:Lar family restriction alleviation protein n=1 Tax=Hyphomonas sp. CY54-11-8 TaxID=1280944 RepID=UPI0018CC6B4F|nr:Lar family restriction alleviation protein [Hyphomonas sp. CY54-11-8]